jgi:hypothetical protein
MSKRPKGHDAILRARAATTLRATVDRIERTYRLATDDQLAEGREWYADAGSLVDVLTDVSGHSREQIAAMISHLSPRTSWSRNVAGAWSLITQGIGAPGILPANVRRARLALKSDDALGTIHGPKTQRFARNILGDVDAVTVDVWATRTALGTRDKWQTETYLKRVGIYDAIEHAFRLAARRLGVDPVTVQATCWIVERGRSSLADVDAEFSAMVDAYNHGRAERGLALI